MFFSISRLILARFRLLAVDSIPTTKTACLNLNVKSDDPSAASKIRVNICPLRRPRFKRRLAHSQVLVIPAQDHSATPRFNTPCRFVFTRKKRHIPPWWQNTARPNLGPDDRRSADQDGGQKSAG